mgnify:CR=1 FL=1
MPESATEWIARLPEGKGYLSAAALPDDKAETLALFTRHAYAFIKQTRVAWRYDEAASQVETTFTATTQVMEGPDNGPLLGLYPHQWFRNASVEGKLGPAYDTVRGQLRLLAAPQFKTTLRYNGFVPHWPAVTASTRQSELKDLLDKDFATAGRELQRIGKSAYWAGKGLQRTMKLAELFEQQGDNARRDAAGWYYFVDRKKDAIRVRGENISSFEIESVVARHPGVLEVAAIAVFLASSESSYVTGQTIYPDGGRLGLNYTVPVRRD